jgi:hypothetical protein
VARAPACVQLRDGSFPVGAGIEQAATRPAGDGVLVAAPRATQACRIARDYFISPNRYPSKARKPEFMLDPHLWSDCISHREAVDSGRYCFRPWLAE